MNLSDNPKGIEYIIYFNGGTNRKTIIAVIVLAHGKIRRENYAEKISPS